MHLNRRLPVYPLKVHRLEQLDDAGLNVADFICFPPRELNEKELRQFCAKFKAVSCRTFSADEDREFKTPVKYEISDIADVLDFARTQNKRYFLLVNEALPLADSIIAGNIYFNSREDFICEFFRGPGTPRDVDTKPLQRVDARRFGSPQAREVEQLVDAVARFRYRPVIFEFSLYPYPVGRLRDRLVFWEWRKA
jgi:hypothetical protein